MAELSELNDKQNILLTQLSYSSIVLDEEEFRGKTLEGILSSLQERAKTGEINKDTEDTINIIQEMCDSGLKNIKIKDVENDSKTGFGAIAFTDEGGATGFSYRGTDGFKWESRNDWFDNITAMLTGTSKQTFQAEKFFDKNRDESGNNYLYGHSKGGELSESVYVNNHKKIKGIHLFNPQPINPFSLTNSQLEAIRSEEVDIIIAEWDYVWFLGSLPSYGNIRIAQNDGENPHLYSSIKNMFNDQNNIIPGSQPTIVNAAYLIISAKLFKYQLVWGKIGFLYNCVVRLDDYVRSNLIPEAKEFIAWVSDKVKAISDDLKEYADELKNFLSDTFEKMIDVFKRNFNAGYNYSSANPDICVDTAKLRNYAQSIQYVRSRVTRLDERLDSLYWRAGLLDLWNLMQANMLIKNNSKLNSCISYLNETATDFESAESEVLNNL